MRKQIVCILCLLLSACASNNNKIGPTLKAGIFPLAANESALALAKSNRGREIDSATREIEIPLLPIYFESASYSIDNQHQIQRLKINIDLLKNNTKKFKITGYCDSDGSLISNRLLGYDRANSVRQFLYSNGIAKDRMSIISGCKNKYKNLTNIQKLESRKVIISLID